MKKASRDFKFNAFFDYSRVLPKPMISLDDEDEDVQAVTPIKPSVSGRLVKSYKESLEKPWRPDLWG
ncbi:unnamed protein product [Calypogeia fissa]